MSYYCDHHTVIMQERNNIVVCEKCGIVKRIEEEKQNRIIYEKCFNIKCEHFKLMKGNYEQESDSVHE